MRNFLCFVLFLVTVCAGSPAFAQSPLSLAEAISRARRQNPDAGIAAVTEGEAAERIRQARAAYLPKVDLAESWQRGNQPAFVFSSRLAERRFTAADFAIDAINHPASTNHFRTVLSIEQPLFDRVAAANVRAASISRDIAASGKHVVALDLTMAVTDAFGQVIATEAAVRSAATAVETARADRELARNRRDAGRVTDADVLQLDVHLSRTLEHQAHAIADARVARAQLNRLMGEPLSSNFTLELVSPTDVAGVADVTALEEEAVKHRPEIAIARQQEQAASAAVDAARASFLPQVAAQAGWELNGGTWNSRSSSWLIGAGARINLFHGLADKARLAEAREQVTRRTLEVSRAETQVRLDVTVALARLEAARSSEVAGRTAAEWARESQRIIRDRYEAGLVDVVVLLRAAEAVQQAETQHSAARVNVLTATAALQRAIGRI